MTIDTQPLRTLDDAKRLQDLVYSAYGLTYHRSFMYEPQRLFDLNQSGQIRSAIAKDDRGSVLGHMATIRPWFESIPEDIAAKAPTAVELGLLIVHPGHRGRDLQSAVGLACLMNEQAANPGLKNLFGKCLTLHTTSQRAGRAMLGRACSLLLGSVPNWVQHELGERPDPMTTIVLQSPCTSDPRPMYVPRQREALVSDLVGASMLGRQVCGVDPGDAVLRGPTRCTRWFEPSRRRGVVHVWDAGVDVVDEVITAVDWLVAGHMEHVTVLLPIDEPGVAAIVPMLEDVGLFFGGFLPDLEGRDTLVMEYLGWNELDTGAISLLGDESGPLKDAVVSDWRRTRGHRERMVG